MSGRYLTKRKKSNPINMPLFKGAKLLINFSQVLKDPDGEDLKLDQNSPSLTLKEISKLAIKAVLQDDQKLSHAQKIELSRLYEQISKSDETPINIDSAKVAQLKERITTVFPAVFVSYSVEIAFEGSLG